MRLLRMLFTHGLFAFPNWKRSKCGAVEKDKPNKPNEGSCPKGGGHSWSSF
jgi:hypothetical protein